MRGGGGWGKRKAGHLNSHLNSSNIYLLLKTSFLFKQILSHFIKLYIAQKYYI